MKWPTVQKGQMVSAFKIDTSEIEEEEVESG